MNGNFLSDIKSFSYQNLSLINRGFMIQLHCFASQRKLETWEEVELNRPKPPTLEGYQKPLNTPDPYNLKRKDFRQFMMGKPERFTREMKVFLTVLGFAIWCLGISWFTVYLMKPDDYEWIEQERKRMETAKRKLEFIINEKKSELNQM